MSGTNIVAKLILLLCFLGYSTACSHNGGYCQTHWDCCSGKCMTYLNMCARKMNNFGYPLYYAVPANRVDDSR